jgi:hypothetical protein
MTIWDKHPLEADLSWKLHTERQPENSNGEGHRQLKKKHHMTEEEKGDQVEREKEHDFWKQQEEEEKEKAEENEAKAEKFEEEKENLYNDPGIIPSHIHGMMIDAGSKGSRIHLYEWKPRILKDEADIDAAVSGSKLSFPTSNTRWTNRIRPGIDEFAYLPDDELVPALADYLNQFLEFARAVLHDQQNEWGSFPIFLRATGGMRIVDTYNRARVVEAVRSLFSNKTYCPFAFTSEQARVISGEEGKNAL